MNALEIITSKLRALEEYVHKKFHTDKKEQIQMASHNRRLEEKVNKIIARVNSLTQDHAKLKNTVNKQKP